MTCTSRSIVVAAALAASGPFAAHAGADAAAGQALHAARCAACHPIDFNDPTGASR